MQSASSSEEGCIIRTSHTALGRFGNRIDIFTLGTTIRGVSLLECADSDVRYFNNSSAAPEELHYNDL